MPGTFRLGLLIASLLLSYSCAALAQGGPSLRGASPPSESGPTKHLMDLKGAPVTAQTQAAAQWKEPAQAEVRIEEHLPSTSSRDAALEETRTQSTTPAPEAEALARERRRADALALQLAVMRQELEVTKRQAAVALQEAAETAQVHVAELSKAQAEEHQRAETLAQELAAARQELEAAKAQMLALQQDQQKAVAVALQEEQKKSAKLAQSLAAARKELKAAKQQSGGAARQSPETAQSQIVEQGGALAPKATAVPPTPEAVTRPRAKAGQRITSAGEDVRAAGRREAEATRSTGAVARQQPITSRQFEWE